MGPKQSSSNPIDIKEENKDDLVKKIERRGGFGKVWRVYNKKDQSTYAMKEMSKTKIIDKKSEKSIKSERDLLSKMNHKFIVNMHYAFQDNDHLYLVLDLLSGGDLRYHVCKYRTFTEEQTKFFIACMLLGLDYCHTNMIIHRDIKPENMVLDSQGYVHITDFGIAKIQNPNVNNSKETSGTPGYMSPEVLCAQNHTMAVDYFAIGVIGFEFMFGVRPYMGRSRKEIKEKILAKQVQIKRHNIPQNWSVESADCINHLLQRKPNKRLGFEGGAREVMNHAWFKGYRWKDLYNKRILAPFIPDNEDNFDAKYCNAIEKQGMHTKERYQEIQANPNYSRIFQDYAYFDRNTPLDNIRLFKNPHDSDYFEESGLNINDIVKNDADGGKEIGTYIHQSAGISKKNITHKRTYSCSQAFIDSYTFVNQRRTMKHNMSNSGGLSVNHSKNKIDLNCNNTTNNINNRTGMNSQKYITINKIIGYKEANKILHHNETPDKDSTFNSMSIIKN